jgi:hypothetical protein
MDPFLDESIGRKANSLSIQQSGFVSLKSAVATDIY